MSSPTPSETEKREVRIETLSIEKLKEICCDFDINPKNVYVEEMSNVYNEYCCKLKIKIKDSITRPFGYSWALTENSSKMCHRVWSRGELYDINSCKECTPLLLPKDTPLTELEIRFSSNSPTSSFSEQLAEKVYNSFLI